MMFAALVFAAATAVVASSSTLISSSGWDAPSSQFEVAPGDPAAFTLFIVNNAAADSLKLQEQSSSISAGTWDDYPPADSIP